MSFDVEALVIRYGRLEQLYLALGLKQRADRAWYFRQALEWISCL